MKSFIAELYHQGDAEQFLNCVTKMKHFRIEEFH